MIKHICYTDHRMTISAEKCKTSALRYGCDQSTILGPSNIDVGFQTMYNTILNQSKGAGYWLWKPYIIKQALNTSDNGDFIVYTDAGVEFVADVNYLINEMTTEIMVFGNGHNHGIWCKMEVLKAMGCEQFADRDQVQASCIIIHNSASTRKFVDEWLKWCCKPGFIDDTSSELPNVYGFKEHRHDQAILTNMCYLYDIKFNRWPAQYKLIGEEKYTNQYPQIFNHHGRRDDGTR